MATKNAKNVISDFQKKKIKRINYWQIDHQIKNITQIPGNIILSSPLAWQKFIWSRKYFEKKPQEGYFIWLKKEVNFPLVSCINIASPKVSQDLTNLLIIEKGIKAQINVICSVIRNNLCGTHKAKGKIILKNGSFLEYNHFHQWGNKDFVSPDYQFILEREAKLIYNYNNLFPPESLFLKTTILEKEKSSSNLNFVINGINSKIGILDSINLLGRNSQALLKLRLVGRKNSRIEAVSIISALSSSSGHLDCQGLLVDNSSKISLTPRLICQNKNAQLTHEASIGKVSEEQLTYLRMRGLTEKEAIDLIVSGFFKT